MGLVVRVGGEERGREGWEIVWFIWVDRGVRSFLPNG